MKRAILELKLSWRLIRGLHNAALSHMSNANVYGFYEVNSWFMQTVSYETSSLLKKVPENPRTTKTTRCPLRMSALALEMARS